MDGIHALQLKFYHGASLDEDAILPHILESKTGMEVQRLMGLVDTDNGLMVQVRWQGLPESEDTLETIEKFAKMSRSYC